MSDFVPSDGDVGSDVKTDIESGSETDPQASTDIDSAIDEPGTWALPDATGVSSVDAAITELARLDELPTSEHVAVYEGLHRQLQDALADLDGS